MRCCVAPPSELPCTAFRKVPAAWLNHSSAESHLLENKATAAAGSKLIWATNLFVGPAVESRLTTSLANAFVVGLATKLAVHISFELAFPPSRASWVW